MTTISAKVVADTHPYLSDRLTTLELRYPWAIHPEFLTHRTFSRNSSSMRAIPTRKLIEDVDRDPYVPVSFGRNQSGMQAGDELDEIGREAAQARWYSAMYDAIRHARQLSEIGLHKQHASRLLMPFAHIRTVVTSTSWDNFFALRISEEAQPEMRMLAEAIRDAIAGSRPCRPTGGSWHCPYAPADLPDGERVKVSAARCARVSYLTHDGREPSIEEDLGLYERLVSQGHVSPLEHQARTCGVDWRLAGNLGPGWEQHRKIVEERARLAAALTV